MLSFQLRVSSSFVHLTPLHAFSLLCSADNLRTPFTNYTSGYKALLDYVWIEPAALEVIGNVPVPSEDEIGSFIPSPAFPSDHLAVSHNLGLL